MREPTGMELIKKKLSQIQAELKDHKEAYDRIESELKEVGERLERLVNQE